MEHIDFEYYKYMIKNLKIKEPVNYNLKNQLKETIDEIFIYENSDEEKELLNLLKNNMTIKELCWAHDMIANKIYEPKLDSIPLEVDEDEIYIKYCTLYKSVKESLGATIKSDKDNSHVIVARIMNGGCIDRSKLFKSNDRILEVNGVNTTHFNAQDVIRLLNPSDGLLKVVIEESNKVGIQDYNNSFEDLKENLPPSCTKKDQHESFNDDLFYARVLFNYKPVHDKMHPCAEASLELKAGDILEICDWSQDQVWWQGRLLSSFSCNNSSSLNAIINVLNSLNQIPKPIASLIPSKKAQEKAIIKNFSENQTSIDVNEIISSFDFKIETDEDGECENNILCTPSTYEELCIFDPTYQAPHKRPIALYFAIDDKIISSFKSGTTICDYFAQNMNICEALNEITRFILNKNQAEGELKLPSIYSLKSVTHATPILTRKSSKNITQIIENPICKLIENSSQQILTKTQWENEQQNSNLLTTVFDDIFGYSLSELWQEFLDNRDQILIFPSFDNFKYFRNITPFGKMCFHVLINLNNNRTNLIKDLNEINNTPKITAASKQQRSSSKSKKSMIIKSKHTVNNVKHLFDAYLDSTNQPFDELVNKLKTFIVKINTIPSFVIK